MRIKNIYVKHYGPLRDREYALFRNLTLFFGPNEAGKTLTIDAVLRLLLGKSIRDFSQIDRVDESPEGYIVLENDQNEEIKLPEKGTLEKVVGLTPSQCRNIFVIRNSDLSIFRESDFYTALMDRLIGLRSQEIAVIKDALREMGRITPSGLFRDIREEKLRTRMERAGDLVVRIGSLIEEITHEKYDALEEGHETYREELERISKEIQQLEEARKREQYEKGMEALTKLKGSLQRVRDLNVYDVREEEQWRDYCRDIHRSEEEKAVLEQNLANTEQAWTIAVGAFTETSREFKALEQRRERLHGEIGQALIDHQKKREDLAARRHKKGLFMTTAVISTTLLGLCLVGAMLRPLPLFIVLTVLFFAGSVILWIVIFRYVLGKASLARNLEHMRLALANLGVTVGNFEEVLAQIQNLDLEFSTKRDTLDDRRRRREILETRIRDLKGRAIPTTEEKIREARAKIDAIKMRSGEGSLEAYTEKVRAKQSLERSAGEQASVLRSHFDAPHEDLETNIRHWEREVQTLEEFRVRAKDTSHSEEAILQLAKRKQEIEAAMIEVERNMGLLQRRLADIERSVNDVLRWADEHLYCRTSVDLKGVIDRLKGFLSEHERDRETALKTIALFEEIEREERDRVSELFEGESSVSAYFRRITRGLYEQVRYDQRLREVKAKRRDGAVVGASKLSGGAYDQLYLSIRLALGEKALDGQKGFFIMDDPFVKADSDRLQRQIGMLKEIADAGWQILYFSAKGEVKNALQEDINQGSVDHKEIGCVFP
jgi:exonuclease SbcC